MIVNGKERAFECITVNELLMEYDLSAEEVVVERNGEILKKESYSEVVLDKKDKIEIVGFIGGG